MLDKSIELITSVSGRAPRGHVDDLGLADPSFAIEAVTLRQTASGSLSFDNVVALLGEIERMVADGDCAVR